MLGIGERGPIGLDRPVRGDRATRSGTPGWSSHPWRASGRWASAACCGSSVMVGPSSMWLDDREPFRGSWTLTGAARWTRSWPPGSSRQRQVRPGSSIASVSSGWSWSRSRTIRSHAGCSRSSCHRRSCSSVAIRRHCRGHMPSRSSVLDARPNTDGGSRRASVRRCATPAARSCRGWPSGSTARLMRRPWRPVARRSRSSVAGTRGSSRWPTSVSPTRSWPAVERSSRSCSRTSRRRRARSLGETGSCRGSPTRPSSSRHR